MIDRIPISHYMKKFKEQRDWQDGYSNFINYELNQIGYELVNITLENHNTDIFSTLQEAIIWCNTHYPKDYFFIENESYSFTEFHFWFTNIDQAIIFKLSCF